MNFYGVITLFLIHFLNYNYAIKIMQYRPVIVLRLSRYPFFADQIRTRNSQPFVWDHFKKCILPINNIQYVIICIALAK